MQPQDPYQPQQPQPPLPQPTEPLPPQDPYQPQPLAQPYVDPTPIPQPTVPQPDPYQPVQQLPPQPPAPQEVPPAPPQPEYGPTQQPGAVPAYAQPGYVPPAMPVDPSAYSQMPPSSPKRSYKTLLIAVAAVIPVVVAVVALVLVLSGGTPKYGSGDTTKYSTNGYSLNVPKDWQDITDKDLEGLDEQVREADSLKIYGYKYDEELKRARSVLLVSGAKDDKISKAQFGIYASQPAFQAEIEKLFKESLAEDAAECKQKKNESFDYAYDSQAPFIDVTGGFDCVPKDDAYAKFAGGTVRQEIRVMFLEGELVGVRLMAYDDDWQKNKDFYKTNVLGSLAAN